MEFQCNLRPQMSVLQGIVSKQKVPNLGGRQMKVILNVSLEAACV